MPEDKYNSGTSAKKWEEGVSKGVDKVRNFLPVESDPFTQVKNLAVRHRLNSVRKNERGNKVYSWDVWTVSGTIAKGAAFRATQRTVSLFSFREKAQTRIVDEEVTGGWLSSKKVVEVEIDEGTDIPDGSGWVSSVENTADRWKDAIIGESE